MSIVFKRSIKLFTSNIDRSIHKESNLLNDCKKLQHSYIKPFNNQHNQQIIYINRESLPPSFHQYNFQGKFQYIQDITNVGLIEYGRSFDDFISLRISGDYDGIQQSIQLINSLISRQSKLDQFINVTPPINKNYLYLGVPMKNKGSDNTYTQIHYVHESIIDKFIGKNGNNLKLIKSTYNIVNCWVIPPITLKSKFSKNDVNKEFFQMTLIGDANSIYHCDQFLIGKLKKYLSWKEKRQIKMEKDQQFYEQLEKEIHSRGINFDDIPIMKNDENISISENNNDKLKELESFVKTL